MTKKKPRHTGGPFYEYKSLMNHSGTGEYAWNYDTTARDHVAALIKLPVEVIQCHDQLACCAGERGSTAGGKIVIRCSKHLCNGFSPNTGWVEESLADVITG